MTSDYVALFQVSIDGNCSVAGVRIRNFFLENCTLQVWLPQEANWNSFLLLQLNQDFFVLVGDKEETFGEQSKNTVCGKFPKYPTGSPLLPYEWVTIMCERNSSLSGRFVTIQKSLDHDQLFACRVPYPKYPDRLEFSEIEAVYADMGKDNIIYNILHIFFILCHLN